MIRNIIFDIGGVLIDLQPQRTLDALRALSRQPIEELSDRELLGGGNNRIVDAYMTGEISDVEFFSGLQQTAKAGVSIAELKEAWNAMLLGLPETRVRTIKSLHKEGVKIALLSNINEEHLHTTKQIFKRADFQLVRDYDYAFYSNELHLAKPNQEIYRIALEKTGFVPEETLYIDDLQQNIEAGATFGLQTLCATGDEWVKVLPRYDFVGLR